MGNFLSAVQEAFTGVVANFSVRHAKILMLGLDNAGKTTVMYKLKLSEPPRKPTTPTIGFSCDLDGFHTATVQPAKNVSFTVRNVEGENKTQNFWNKFFRGSDGFIYVVDASDYTKFEEARKELSWVLEFDEMAGVPMVVFANKQDLPNAASPSEVADHLGLSKIQSRKWHVQGTTATLGDGLFEGMEELSELVKDFQSNNRKVTS